MFDIKTVETELGGKTLKLETGRVARQADGAVLATLGETVVLCAVTAAKSVKPGQDFFPLTVDYRENTYAAGKIPGGFFKREGRPNEKEILTSRMIDRPLRPLFPEGYNHETQVIGLLLSADLENDSAGFDAAVDTAASLLAPDDQVARRELGLVLLNSASDFDITSTRTREQSQRDLKRALKYFAEAVERDQSGAPEIVHVVDGVGQIVGPLHDRGLDAQEW